MTGATIKSYLRDIAAALLPFYRKALNRIKYLEGVNTELSDLKNFLLNNQASSDKIISDLYYSLLDLKQKYEKPNIGSKDWLEIAEYKYGGTEKKIKRKKVSEFDPRTSKELEMCGMIGGDRMSRIEHNYAPIYTRYLKPFVMKKDKVVLVEVGILKGTGLAIWSDLFDNSRIIGLDIDLSYIEKNMASLKNKNAFKNNNLELYEFDQFKDNKRLITNILKGDKINIMIDDGAHLDNSILKTMDSVMPFMDDNFVYFVEDNDKVHLKIIERYPDYKVVNYGEMTVITKL